MKILIIDNLFQPNLKGKLANGAQKFTRNQVSLLSALGETFYITAKGSERQYDNQIILNSFFDLSIENRSDKIAQTRLVISEVLMQIKIINPDVILDSSCKHLSSIWENYPIGIIFEHYHKPSMILSSDMTKRFSNKNVFWCGVSVWQNKKFNNYFNDTINIHYIDILPEEIKPSEEYGIFIGRWDGGKNPHVMLKNYIKSNPKFKLKCFIKMGGSVIPEKELEFLRKSEFLEFYIDMPREIILDSISKAKFGIGMGNESTGIVSLEYATYGVPYIVTGTKSVAESEHLPEFALHLCDRNLETSIPDQISEHVKSCLAWDLDKRKLLSKTVIDKYTADHFIGEHLRIINKSKNLKGNSLYEI